MAPDTIEAYDGTEVDVDVIKPLSGGGARVELDATDGGRWRLDVNSTGSDYEVITSWNSAGELADVDLPDWAEDILLRLARA
jgi:hypothetical protein